MHYGRSQYREFETSAILSSLNDIFQSSDMDVTNFCNDIVESNTTVTPNPSGLDTNN